MKLFGCLLLPTGTSHSSPFSLAGRRILSFLENGRTFGRFNYISTIHMGHYDIERLYSNIVMGTENN